MILLDNELYKNIVLVCNDLSYKAHCLYFSEERRLLDEERVLYVQLNWGKDVREGRFLLRREVRNRFYQSLLPLPLGY